MSDLPAIAEIVKNPEAIKLLMGLLGYKFLEPVLGQAGDGLGKIVYDNLEHVREVIIRKRKEEDKKTNLRVAMEGFRSASFVDSKIAAEYFGGILASSGNSEDDSLIAFLAIIKDLSSKQLYLHYVIYRKLHDFIINDSDWNNKNLGMQNDISNMEIFFSSKELEKIDLTPSEDLVILHRSGVINSYEYGHEKLEDNQIVPFTKITPTTLGFQLYAVVHNEYNKWRELGNLPLEVFPDIKIPKFCFKKKDELIELAKKLSARDTLK